MTKAATTKVGGNGNGNGNGNGGNSHGASGSSGSSGNGQGSGGNGQGATGNSHGSASAKGNRQASVADASNVGATSITVKGNDVVDVWVRPTSRLWAIA